MFRCCRLFMLIILPIFLIQNVFADSSEFQWPPIGKGLTEIQSSTITEIRSGLLRINAGWTREQVRQAVPYLPNQRYVERTPGLDSENPSDDVPVETWFYPVGEGVAAEVRFRGLSVEVVGYGKNPMIFVRDPREPPAAADFRTLVHNLFPTTSLSEDVIRKNFGGPIELSNVQLGDLAKKVNTLVKSVLGYGLRDLDLLVYIPSRRFPFLALFFMDGPSNSTRMIYTVEWWQTPGEGRQIKGELRPAATELEDELRIRETLQGLLVTISEDRPPLVKLPAFAR